MKTTNKPKIRVPSVDPLNIKTDVGKLTRAKISSMSKGQAAFAVAECDNNSTLRKQLVPKVNELFPESLQSENESKRLFMQGQTDRAAKMLQVIDDLPPLVKVISWRRLMLNASTNNAQEREFLFFALKTLSKDAHDIHTAAGLAKVKLEIPREMIEKAKKEGHKKP